MVEKEKNNKEYHVHFRGMGAKCELVCGLGPVISPLCTSIFHWASGLRLARCPESL